MYSQSMLAEASRLASRTRTCFHCGNGNVKEIHRSMDGETVYCKYEYRWVCGRATTASPHA